jgi:hypothetical protein
MKREENRYGMEIKIADVLNFKHLSKMHIYKIFLLIEKFIKALYHLLKIVLLRSSYRL